MLYAGLVLVLSLAGICFNCKFIYLLHKSPALPTGSRVYLQNLGFASLCYCIGALLSFITNDAVFAVWDTLPIPVSDGTYCYIWFTLEVLAVIVKGHGLFIFTVDLLKSRNLCKFLDRQAVLISIIIWTVSLLMVAAAVLPLKVKPEVYASLSAVKRCEITRVVNFELLSIVVAFLGASALLTAAFFAGLYRKTTTKLSVYSFEFCEPSASSLANRYTCWLEHSLVQLALPFAVSHLISWITLMCISFWYQGRLVMEYTGERLAINTNYMGTAISMPFLFSACVSPLCSLHYKSVHGLLARLGALVCSFNKFRLIFVDKFDFRAAGGLMTLLGVSDTICKRRI